MPESSGDFPDPLDGERPPFQEGGPSDGGDPADLVNSPEPEVIPAGYEALAERDSLEDIPHPEDAEPAPSAEKIGSGPDNVAALEPAAAAEAEQEPEAKPADGVVDEAAVVQRAAEAVQAKRADRAPQPIAAEGKTAKDEPGVDPEEVDGELEEMRPRGESVVAPKEGRQAAAPAAAPKPAVPPIPAPARPGAADREGAQVPEDAAPPADLPVAESSDDGGLAVGSKEKTEDTLQYIVNQHGQRVARTARMESQDRTDFDPLDVNGRGWLKAFTIEGADPGTGMVYSVAERDERGLPTRVTGMVNLPNTPSGEFGEPEGVHTKYKYMDLSYDSDGFLIYTHETFDEGPYHKEIRRRTMLDNNNTYRGHVVERLIDIHPVTGKKVFDVAQVNFDVSHPGLGLLYRLRFTGHKAGLVPHTVSIMDLEGENNVDGRPGLIYRSGLSTSELWPYMQMARPHGEVALHAVRAVHDYPETIIMPGFIPKSRAEELAMQTEDLYQLGVVQPYQELRETVLLTPLEATQKITAMDDVKDLIGLISEVAQRKIVVLNQTSDLRSHQQVTEVMGELGWDFVDNMKRVAVLAALHPAVFRAETVPPRDEHTSDIQETIRILRSIMLDRERLVNTIQQVRNYFDVRGWNKLMYIAKMNLEE